MRRVFSGGVVFDGTPSRPQRLDVAVADDRVVEVGHRLAGDEVIDCSGRLLLPGLIDCHVHIAWGREDFDELAVMYKPFSYRFFQIPQNLTATLAKGITYVRDAGGADLGLKQAVANGVIRGPKMHISVNMLSPTGGHADFCLPSGGHSAFDVQYPGMPSPVCDGVHDATKKVREIIRAGADVIKICTSGGYVSPSDDPHHPGFSLEETKAIVRTAAEYDIPVMAHAHSTNGIRVATLAGVRSVEHGTFMDEETAELMVEHGTWLVPTLTTGDSTEEFLNDPGVPESVKAKMLDIGHPELDAFRIAARAGVKIAMGTDCPETPHGTNLRELMLMSENGLSPVDSLVAATSSAAELLGLGHERGTLEPGNVADIVVVAGDDLDFATFPARIESVWVDGSRAVGDL